MGGTYLLWHTQRQGWVGTAGTTTDIKDARRFTRLEALAAVKRSKGPDSASVLLPICEDDL